MDNPLVLFLSCSLLLLLPLPLTFRAVHANLLCYDEFLPANSTYARNRDNLLSSLASNVTARGGFYNASLGRNSDRVNAFALCRRGYEPRACISCVDRVSRNLIKTCTDQKQAYSWDGDNDVSCVVRYSSSSSFGKLELKPPDSNLHPNNIDTSNMTFFRQQWESMVNRTLEAASTANTSSVLKYYAVTRAEFTEFPNVFSLMQCFPDISEAECNQCLGESVSYYQERFWGRQGGEVTRPSCFFRWDLYPFYGAFDNLTRIPSPPRPSPQSPGGNDQTNFSKRNNGSSFRSGTIAIIVVPTAINIFVFVALVYAYHRRKKLYVRINESADSDHKFMLRFDLDTIITATDDFSDENTLGQGGFGSVYKGILPNGQEIAVKRLTRGSGQGDLEFKNEVLLLTRLQHRNLVKLLGFCNERDEDLLVYEFVPNSSLDRFIFDPDKRSLLTWDVRYKIIEGIVRGLLYLHEDSQLRIIHRDLKTSNILLDAEMNSKVSDFGMARVFNVDETRGETSRVVGTYGYMAPEYVKHGQFSVKSDVYSFGVVLLEIISGERNKNFEAEGLPAFAWKSWVEGRAADIIDPVMSNGPRSEIMKFIHIGLLCVQENVEKRPTMNSVNLWLGSETTTMPLPTASAFITHPLGSLEEPSPSSSRSRGADGTFSVNEVSVSVLDPR
ncbi:PREDICTED: putative cysteine-rich receptor-like protein kinase 39 isoform X1 [Tarenaya hassleriana]|uniref:putative cysteine-rich receptor-like protein kinase 39 isoform X1 n=1 Tax=Tarenaya hassleriana TaxID=28532 RepID=UPI00053C1D40|nr:PREDICTED: putative cysteine-rich receptor-like protein kinase 39 isoform X1 [Tarenaya hassleriana]